MKPIDALMKLHVFAIFVLSVIVSGTASGKYLSIVSSGVDVLRFDSGVDVGDTDGNGEGNDNGDGNGNGNGNGNCDDNGNGDGDGDGDISVYDSACVVSCCDTMSSFLLNLITSFLIMDLV